MIGTLILLIVLIVVLGVGLWVIGQIPMDPPFAVIAKAVLALVVFLILVFGVLLPLASGIPHAHLY